MNHKRRLYRVYRAAGLTLRQKKRKDCVRVGQPLHLRLIRSGRWISCPMRVACGRAIRVLGMIDAYWRECLALEVDASFAGRRVTRAREINSSARDGWSGDPCENESANQS